MNLFCRFGAHHWQTQNLAYIVHNTTRYKCRTCGTEHQPRSK